MDTQEKKSSFGKRCLILAACMALLAAGYAALRNTAGWYLAGLSGEESLGYFCSEGTWYQWDLEGEPVAVEEPAQTQGGLEGYTLSNQPDGLFLVAEDGTESQFQVEGLLPESIRSCQDGSAVLGRTEDGTLYLFSVRKGALESQQKIDTQVTEAAFTATKQDIYYQKGTSFYYCSGGVKAPIAEHVLSLAASTENQWIYYVAGESDEDETGQLVLFHVGRETVLDENVAQVVYCGGGKALYRKGDGSVWIAAGETIESTVYRAEQLRTQRR